jgi:hypothetical protein
MSAGPVDVRPREASCRRTYMPTLDYGIIGVLGVVITVLSWHGGRQTQAILQEQSRILRRQGEILAQMRM